MFDVIMPAAAIVTLLVVMSWLLKLAENKMPHVLPVGLAVVVAIAAAPAAGIGHIVGLTWPPVVLYAIAFAMLAVLMRRLYPIISADGYPNWSRLRWSNRPRWMFRQSDVYNSELAAILEDLKRR